MATLFGSDGEFPHPSKQSKRRPRDKRYEQSPKGKAAAQRFRDSPKRKEILERAAQSPTFKKRRQAIVKKFRESDKGKANSKRYSSSDKGLKRKRDYQAKVKLKCLVAYGGDPPKCAWCGETEPKSLTLDHVNDDGAAHRKKLMGNPKFGGYRFYLILVRLNFPKDPPLQVLCYNCNNGLKRAGIRKEQQTELELINSAFDLGFLLGSLSK